MDYGLLRERFAALVTDGLRAKYLEAAGYDTQVLESVSYTHLDVYKRQTERY